MENEGKEDESGAGGCASVTWPVSWHTWMTFHDGDTGRCRVFYWAGCCQDVKCQSFLIIANVFSSLNITHFKFQTC